MQIQVGDIIRKKYRIQGLLGKGSTGVVYRAKDLLLKKTVALKFLRSEYVHDLAQRKRFIKEARMAGHFTHSRVVPVREISTWKETLYIVMEYYSGKTLKDFLTRQRFSLEEANQLAQQLLACLEDAHCQNLLHRDIKPSNLMLQKKQHKYQLFILDFGLACYKEQKKQLPAGTLLYMAPEQLLGDQIDHRSDLYSAAVCIYQMLTGQLPVIANDVEQYTYKLLKSSPLPPSFYNKSIPHAVDKVILKALSVEASERYQSAQEFATALETATQKKYLLWLKKGAMVAGVLLCFYLSLWLAQQYYQKVQHQEWLETAQVAWQNKEYNKAMEAARQVLRISYQQQAVNILQKSLLIKLREWEKQENWQEIEKTFADPLFQEEYFQILYEYILFYNTSRQISLLVEQGEHVKALQKIAHFKGNSHHKNILAQQQQRIQARIQLQQFEQSYQHNKIPQAQEYLQKLQGLLPEHWQQQLIAQTNELTKRQKYQSFLGYGDYWKALELAQEFQDPLLRQGLIDKAENFLQQQVKKCFLLAPKNLALVKKKSIKVKVGAPKEVAWQFLRVNGKQLTYDQGNFFAQLTLAEGQQQIVLSYQRENQQIVADQITVFLDQTPPRLEIEDFSIQKKNGILTIEGKAYDSSGVAEVYFKHYQAQPLEQGFKKWQLVLPMEQLKNKQIVLSAKDKLGSVSHKSFTLPRENAPPEILIESPAANSAVYSSQIKVVGSVTDESGIRSLIVAEKEVSFHNFPENEWVAEVKLQEKYLIGPNWVIPIEAVDHWGNKSATRLYVKPEHLFWQSLQAEKINAHYKKIWGMCYSPPDGKYLVIASDDGRLSIWNTNSYKTEWVDKIAARSSHNLKVTPAVRFVAEYLADLTRKERTEFLQQNLLAGSWRVNREDLSHYGLDKFSHLFDNHLTCLAFSTSKQQLAMGHSSGHLRVVNLADSRYLTYQNIHSGEIIALAYSFDNRWLASASGDHTVKIWDTENYNLSHILKHHTMSVTCLAFSYNNKILATASRDKSVCLWSVETGELIRRLRGHTEQIETLAFHPSRVELTSAGSGGKVFIWRPK